MIVLYSKILSLLFCALLGFIAGRYLDICQKTLATIIVYIVSPVFCFYIMATTKLPLSDFLTIPISTFICLSVGVPSLVLGRKLFADSRANLLSLTLSVPNAGYFGYPMVIVMLGDDYLPLQNLIGLGVALSVYTYGFYIMNRSKFNTSQCLAKVLRLPILYATAAGVIFANSGLIIPDALIPGFELFKGAYGVLGLMMIGVGLGKAGGFRLDYKLISAAMTGKFIFYPIITFAILWLDSNYLQLLNKDTHILFVLSAFMPLGINTINFAAITKQNESEAATIVVVSTFITCLLIPLLFEFLKI